MINLEDAVKYIEFTRKVKLKEYQIELLVNIMQKKITDCPRGCGKTLVINGYADYLNNVHDMCKHSSLVKADETICGERVIKETPSLLPVIKSVFATNPDVARREFNMDFTSYYLTIDENTFKKEDK